MLVLGVNPGHDGAIAAIADRELVFCLEAEKDSYLRHQKTNSATFLAALEHLGDVPDVIGLGGQYKEWFIGTGHLPAIEAGYWGSQAERVRDGVFCGKAVKVVSSSHIRSHIIGVAGMAPRDDADQRAVLIWEGDEGTFYLLDENWQIAAEHPVMRFPGGRYALLFGIANPDYPPHVAEVSTDDAGKLMALAAYGDPHDVDPAIAEPVERILKPDGYVAKGNYEDAPFYNAGVEADVTKAAAAYLHRRLFEEFAHTAERELPEGIPLYIAGGCGLNCDWNTAWKELGQFSSVFVPPCPNDSGAGLGHAIDALHAVTGDPHIDWNVYSGLEFEWDKDPNPVKWRRQPLNYGLLADAIAAGSVVAWIQGRWELGPRALGNRSLLAEPFHESTKDRLNDIKLREGYRPIAPCARMEDVPEVYDRDFDDPYMLYFRMATRPDLKAVTHVDGSARVQTVTRESNRPQHELLSAFAERHGVGVLCNTSLNFKGMGFINRMSDLEYYCEWRNLSDMVVGDAWFQRVPG